MERSRSNKRNYYYDNSNNNNNNGGQDFYDSENLGRTKPRYNPHHHQNRRGGGGGGGGMGRKIQEIGGGGGGGSSSAMVTTSYRILCHDLKAGGVIGKSGSIIKAIRQHTGAWINVHELVPGDEERIIEITDTRRRDPDGRMPSFSPAQEALFLVHERILESEFSGGSGGGYNSNGMLGEDGDEYGGGGGLRGNRVATRLVVSRMHVGSLLGKGGKIIEQMRVETKTHIRILPRDHTLPRCVSMSEEIVQIVGDIPAVKNALANVSSRLRESQHRDRSHFQHRDNFYPAEDDFIPHMNNGPRRSSIDSPRFGSQLSPGMSNTRQNMYSSHQPGYRMDSGSGPITDNGQQAVGEDLVFRILCPTDKVDCVVGESEGIIELLREEIGVDVKVTDPMADSEEQIIIISSDEGPDDELFPAQEALLHVQTRIVDLIPDKDNIVTTRLLVPSGEVGCLEGKDGSLSEMKKLTGADIEILPRDKVPEFVSGNDELLQIVGEIKAARNAVVEITTKLRNHMYREIFQKNEHSGQPVPGTLGSGSGIEAPSPRNISQIREGQIGNNRPTSVYQNLPPAVVSQPSKDSVGSGSDITRQSESATREDTPSVSNRKPLQLVTRSILEVVVPEYAIPKLVARSKNKIVQISELSGARLTLVDDVAEGMEKVIQISGTREQVERAQSLLQGFILSTHEEDGP